MDRSNRWLDRISGEMEELDSFIAEGEHQKQDFKFRIDSSYKIAITLCAFANTNGGRILIGVKDNGRISGVDPEEEYYMIEGAANMYCKPAVEFQSRVFEDAEGNRVLEVYTPPSENKPHYCQDISGKWIAYIRQEDENYRINRVIINWLKDKNPVSSRKNLVAYGKEERLLFDYLSEYPDISLSKFSKLAEISIESAENILVSFLKWGVISYRASDKGVRFALSPDHLS